jgi:RNA polymerase sigma-70 factor, ECF subfamily
MTAPQPDDPALLAAVARGDRDALRELYARHAPWLQVRLSRRCADRDVVAEAMQDTFVAAWRAARNWSGRGDVGAWLWGIAIRRLVDALAGRRPTQPLADYQQDTSPSAEETVLSRVEHSDVAAALNDLSPELRAVVQATVLDGLSTREAARLLRVPQGTVKTRMRRARHQLREALT